MNKFIWAEIETTSHCNAKCPECCRRMVKFTPKHLELDIIKKLPFGSFEQVLLLGNKGDSIFYPHLFELIEWMDHNDIRIHTNASAHGKEWWSSLAKLLKGKGKVIYALDGLEDTHKLYRIGTDFHKIVENIRIFNKNGGESTCQMIKFEHNEHQIDDVKKLAKSIGSKHFRLKGYRYNEYPRCNFLLPSFTLTVDGNIKPCCYLADDIEHLKEYGKEPSISLHKYSFWEIMESPYYQWMHENCKKLDKCNETCK